MDKYSLLTFINNLKEIKPQSREDTEEDMLVKKYYDIIFVNQIVEDETLNTLDEEEIIAIKRIMEDYGNKNTFENHIITRIQCVEYLKDNIKYMETQSSPSIDDYF